MRVVELDIERSALPHKDHRGAIVDAQLIDIAKRDRDLGRCAAGGFVPGWINGQNLLARLARCQTKGGKIVVIPLVRPGRPGVGQGHIGGETACDAVTIGQGEQNGNRDVVVIADLGRCCTQLEGLEVEEHRIGALEAYAVGRAADLEIGRAKARGDGI